MDEINYVHILYVDLTTVAMFILAPTWHNGCLQHYSTIASSFAVWRLNPTLSSHRATTAYNVTNTYFPVPSVGTIPTFSCRLWTAAGHQGPGVCSCGRDEFSAHCKRLTSFALLFLNVAEKGNTSYVIYGSQPCTQVLTMHINASNEEEPGYKPTLIISKLDSLLQIEQLRRYT